MKKFVYSLAIASVLTASSFLTAPPVHAVDMWAYTAHDRFDNYQAYVITETIKWTREKNATSCVVKEVQPDGSVRKTTWYFHISAGAWRYSTSRMSGGHTNIVKMNEWSGAVLYVCLKNRSDLLLR